MKNLKKLSVRLLPALIVLILVPLANVNATIYTMNLVLSGQEEVPANPSPAVGALIGTYDDVSNALSFTLNFNGLLGPTTAAHIHGPADPGTNGPVLIPLAGFPVGVQAGSYTNTFILTPDQESQLLCGHLYVNVHTAIEPGGEIRSQLKNDPAVGNITPINIGVIGENEVPGNDLPGAGILNGTYDNASNLLSINLTFSGLLGTTTAAHIHGPAGPGVNGPVLIPLAGFPVGVTSGAYANSFPLTTEQESWLFDGLLYVNIHTTVLPGGEIRGQLGAGTLVGDCGAQVIPVSNWALILGGLLIMAFTVIMTRRRS